MKTMINPSDGGRFSSSQFEQIPANGRGRGLESLGAALTAAGIANTPAAAGVASMSLRELLAGGATPAGGLLLECQGQADLALAGNCVARLAARIAGAGRIITDDERKESIAAAACALTVWRATGAGCDGEPETLAARVAWRAAVRELSRDWLGESIPLCTVSEDWLWFNREQRDESRAERAARLRVERLATGRKLRLLRRLDNLPAGRGQRAELISKLQAAALALLAGLRLDEAAALAGFKASGRTAGGFAAVGSVQAAGVDRGRVRGAAVRLKSSATFTTASGQPLAVFVCGGVVVVHRTALQIPLKCQATAQGALLGRVRKSFVRGQSRAHRGWRRDWFANGVLARCQPARGPIKPPGRDQTARLKRLAVFSREVGNESAACSKSG